MRFILILRQFAITYLFNYKNTRVKISGIKPLYVSGMYRKDLRPYQMSSPQGDAEDNPEINYERNMISNSQSEKCVNRKTASRLDCSEGLMDIQDIGIGLGMLSSISSRTVESLCNVKDPESFGEFEDSLKFSLRDAQDDLEELKMINGDLSEQLHNYRFKFLQAQQQVEEQKTQIELMEIDKKKVNDQIQFEIQKLKMQFQDKLLDLAPLPDVLKSTQQELFESQHMKTLAEENVESLAKELVFTKDKVVSLINELNYEKSAKKNLEEEVNKYNLSVTEYEKALEDNCRELDSLKIKIARTEEQLSHKSMLLTKKSSECIQNSKDIEFVRQDSLRAMGRCKERADSTRKQLQGQISELEKQLVQSRALCRAAQKERDEARQRMEYQLNGLSESFEMVETRLRGLQGQVSTLKFSYLGSDDNSSIDDCNSKNANNLQ